MKKKIANDTNIMAFSSACQLSCHLSNCIIRLSLIQTKISMSFTQYGTSSNHICLSTTLLISCVSKNSSSTTEPNSSSSLHNKTPFISATATQVLAVHLTVYNLTLIQLDYTHSRLLYRLCHSAQIEKLELAQTLNIHARFSGYGV